MSKILLFIVSILIVLFISVLLSYAYILFYKKWIAKKLSSGNIRKGDGKQMISPGSFFIRIFIVLIMLMLFFMIFGSVEISKKGKVSLYPCSSNSPVSEFDADSDISGYTRKIINDENVRIVCYYRSSDEEDGFPDALIYVESSSDKDISLHFRESKKNSKLLKDKIRSSAKWYTIDSDNYNVEIILSVSSEDGEKDYTLKK